MSKRTVQVIGEPQRVNTVDREGNSQPWGEIVVEEYEGEEHYSYSFLEDGSEEPPTLLGTSNRLVRPVDPARALAPVLENGWKLQRFYGSSRDYRAILVQEGSSRIPDPIQWDHNIWWGQVTDRDDDGVRYLSESLIVDGGISPRQSLVYSHALHRSICDNGLTAKVMDFGRLRIGHKSFNDNSVINSVNGWQGFTENDTRIMGPDFGSPEAAGRLHTFINRNFLTPDDADGPGLIRIPGFLAKTAATFNRLPNWYLREYAIQMQMMADGLNRRIRGLDVLNAITNPLSQEDLKDEDERRAVTRIVSKQESLFTATMQMMGTFDLMTELN